MKKITFLMIALLCAVVTFAAGPKKQFSQLPFMPAQADVQLSKPFAAKQAPASLAKKFQKSAKAMAHTPKRAVAAADLVGDYTWDYQTASEMSTDLESLETTAGSAHVAISLDEQGGTASTEATATFNFNEMDVPVSATGVTEGDITEDKTITDGDVTLTISPSTTSTANRFWSTANGPQLRVYSGTLTFAVPEGYVMTQAVFTANKWNDGNTADSGELNGTTWTGEAQGLVLTIAANTQINKIEVTYSTAGEEPAGEAIVISGMFDESFKATVLSDEDGDYFMIEGGQKAGSSQYGDYVLYGLFYYEGDDTNEAGWYYDNIYGFINSDGTITIYPWLVRVLSGGQYDRYSLSPYWVEGGTFSPTEPLTLVEVPEGTEILPYVMTYKDSSNATASKAVNVAVDGNDVYFQGLSEYLPEAWVKGTKEANTVTFPAMQWVGYYSIGDAYAFYNGDAVFTYDAEANTYSAEGNIFGVLADKYYDGNYTDPVLKGVVEKAATPANPAITALKNGDYGYYITFNVPLEDTEGEPLMASKLSYIIYTDIEGEIAPLTFTSATHTRLTEDLTEIPAGFSEGYDFYDTQIYLNELYSANWNNLGIQSIYRGGGEENATEIQWFHIKDYAEPSETTATFNFNEMDVPVSATGVTEGDITEDKTITEGSVSLTISPSSADTANRFWSTAAGPQLRVYGGTLTFSVPEGSNITQIVFNHNGKWGANTVEGVEISNDSEANAATWTGEAQTVVVTIAANSQINSIDVTVVSEGGEQPVVDDELVTLPEGVEAQEYTLVASGATSQGSISIQGTKLVAFDGNDVYVQGLAYYFPDAFIKGTLTEAGQVAFPSGQFVGEDDYGKEYIVGVTVDDDYNFVYAPTILFDYDQESGVLSLADGIYYGESDASDKTSLYNYFQSAVYTPGAFVVPDLVELPEGVETEAWTIDGKFSDSQGSDNIVRQTEVAFDGADIYVKGIPFYFEEAWMKGTINAETGIATFPTGQFVGSDDYGLEFMVGSEDGETPCDIEFTYDAEAKQLTQLTPYIYENGGTADEIAPYGYWSDMIIYAGEPVVEEPVTAPEGLETETYLFAAKMIENETSRKAEGDLEPTEVTFDFNASEVATSSNESTDGDILEALELTEGSVTLTVSTKDEDAKTENRFWSTANGPQLRVYSGTLTFEVPEGSSMTQIAFNAGKWNDGNTADSGAFDGAIWTGDAQKVVVTIAGNTQINNIVVSVKSEGTEPGTETGVNYTYQMQVGFDGNDVYFKGLSDNTADMWLKGTLSEDGKTVTIPANQYMGTMSALWFNFNYYFTAVDAEGAMQDIVLSYDAEANKFTTDQILVLHDGKRSLGEPYQTFYNVVIKKMEEFAATPADPEITEFRGDAESSYRSVLVSIPTVDTEGNELLTAKLFYTIWVEKKEGAEQLTFTTDLYTKLTEDMTEIPYGFDDAWDIYNSGRIYLNQSVDEIKSWTKIGVQSIYYGGGECHESNIGWFDNPMNSIATGISTVGTDNSQKAVIFDLQGRSVANPAKGLYIVNGKKVVLK